MFIHQKRLQESQPASDLYFTFADRLDPDQARQNFGPDLDQLFDSQMVIMNIFFEIVNLEKSADKINQEKKLAKLPDSNMLIT